MQTHNKDLARELRRCATPEERRLWSWLRQRPLGCKFRRQAPIGSYIVDFACFSRRLVIEVDGAFHAYQDKDVVREAWLTSHGWTVVRYWNRQVRFELESVCQDIENHLTRETHPPG